MSIQFTEELIAPCGMNCGVCKRYLATVRSLYKSKGYAGCIGCIPRSKKCSIIQKSCSLLSNNKIRFCFECSEFPCEKLNKLNHRYTTKYNTSLIQNLLDIRSKGLNQWLREEEKRWKCGECGGTVSIHDLICYDCGHKGTK